MDLNYIVPKKNVLLKNEIPTNSLFSHFVRSYIYKEYMVEWKQFEIYLSHVVFGGFSLLNPYLQFYVHASNEVFLLFS
jgi:hypothetical protein